MMIDVKKRALWRDSWKGRVTLWLALNKCAIGVVIGLILMGVVL